MNPRWIRFWAIVNGALVVLLVGAALFGQDGVVRHERLAEELRQVHTLNEDLQRENQRLTQVAHALRYDSDYVEHVIRDELGWVRDDEIVFFLP